jgi:hypothetical protein
MGNGAKSEQFAPNMSRSDTPSQNTAKDGDSRCSTLGNPPGHCDAFCADAVHQSSWKTGEIGSSTVVLDRAFSFDPISSLFSQHGRKTPSVPGK